HLLVVVDDGVAWAYGFADDVCHEGPLSGKVFRYTRMVVDDARVHYPIYTLTILTVLDVSRDPVQTWGARVAVRKAPATVSSCEASRQTTIERTVSSIGPRVREQRRVHGLSLQQAAALAGVSAASIHKVERGDMVPTITTLLKLAGAFGLPLSSFVDDTVDDS